MSNPVLNERTMRQAPTTWAAPEPTTDHFPPPVTDGPIGPWKREVMTVSGTVSATATLLVLLLVSASLGWWQTETVDFGDGTSAVAGFPALAWVGLIVGIGLVFLLWTAACRPELPDGFGRVRHLEPRSESGAGAVSPASVGRLIAHGGEARRVFRSESGGRLLIGLRATPGSRFEAGPAASNSPDRRAREGRRRRTRARPATGEKQACASS